MNHWSENDGQEHDNRAARRDKLLIAVASVLVILIAMVPLLL